MADKEGHPTGGIEHGCVESVATKKRMQDRRSTNDSILVAEALPPAINLCLGY